MNRRDRWQARARAVEPRPVTEATRLRCEQACATHAQDLKPRERVVLEVVAEAGSCSRIVQRHQLDAALGILSRFPELTTETMLAERAKHQQSTEGNTP